MQGSIIYDANKRPIYRGSPVAERLWSLLSKEVRAVMANHTDLILLLEDEAGQIERGIETEDVAIDTINMLANEAKGMFGE